MKLEGEGVSVAINNALSGVITDHGSRTVASVVLKSRPSEVKTG